MSAVCAELDADAPEIPDRESDLDAFIADVTARYCVREIYLFGSRGGGAKDPRERSDWDVLVFTDDAESIVCDNTLQRHFGEFLDLFAIPKSGCWYYPPWTTVEGMRGWFPESHREIEGNLVRVYPSEGGG